MTRRTFTPLSSILSTFYGPGPAPEYVACGTCARVMASTTPTVKVDDFTGATYCSACAVERATIPLCDKCGDADAPAACESC